MFARITEQGYGVRATVETHGCRPDFEIKFPCDISFMLTTATSRDGEWYAMVCVWVPVIDESQTTD